MYSFPNFEPVHCSMSGSKCWFLTCTQVSQEAGKVVWYSYLLKNFPQFVDPHSQKPSHSQWSRSRCFSGILLLFCDPVVTSNLIFGSSASSQSSLYIWAFLIHILFKPSLNDFEHYYTSMQNKHNYAVVWRFILWHCPSLGLEWELTFPVLWPFLSFPNLLTCWVQHFNSIIF